MLKTVVSQSSGNTVITGGSIDNTPIGATTPSTGAFTTLIISDNSANAALRVTQIGAGNALLVEDSANPDATPFVVDASGKVAIGSTTATENLNLVSTGRNFFQLTRASTDTAQSVVSFRKARGTPTAPTIVASGDIIGDIQFNGYDGAAYITSASIYAAVDGTPGVNDMPTRLQFFTTADGASTTTERMRIDNAGNVGIGTSSPNASALLDVQSTTKGVRMPNMTTAQKNAIASPAAGLMVFDTTLAKLCVYSGAAWQTITSV